MYKFITVFMLCLFHEINSRNECVHKHHFMNSITHESWLWIQSQCMKSWGTAYFTAYYSIELYIKFNKFDSFTNIISWICLCCINRGYYNIMYWRMHEIHSINIVYKTKIFFSPAFLSICVLWLLLYAVRVPAEAKQCISDRCFKPKIVFESLLNTFF